MFENGVVVRYGVADRAHENEFFRYFARSVKAYFDKKSIPALLIGMPECRVDSRLQIDALLITAKTLTIIDFKDYGGTLVLPDEPSFKKGQWKTVEGLIVKGGCSPNPFYQTGLQRERLIKILETFCRNLTSFNARHISTMICFSKKMQIRGHIPGSYRSYFHIADEESFLEKLFDTVCAGRENNDLLSKLFLDCFNKKIFSSTEYDLVVNPKSLGIECAQIPPAQFAKHQQQHKRPATFIDKIRSFLKGNSPVLIVTGTVGSDKAQLAPIIREEAFRVGFSSARVFALSNRVKRNLTSAIDEVESLYSTLFDFSAAKIDENGKRFIPRASLEECSPFSDCMSSDEENHRHVFVVYESQLITNSDRTEEMVQFGTGHLLSDLLSHLGIGNEKCVNKIVFVGDRFQLGFGSWSESCLNENWYKDSISVETIELPDVQNPTGIQETCLQIANAIRQGRTTNLVLEENDQVKICDGRLERELLENAGENSFHHKVLAYTNKQASDLNNYTKTSIIGNGKQPTTGDVVVFENQAFAYPSAHHNQPLGSVPQFDDTEPKRVENGKTGTIVNVDKNEENWLVLEEQVAKDEAPVRLTLVNADIRLDSSRASETYRIPFILELLQSDSAKLSPMQEMALKIHLSRLLESHMKTRPFEKSHYFNEMMISGDYFINEAGQYRDKKDHRFLTVYERRYRNEMQREILEGNSEYSRWLNAAQIKYGWCMTVHKAMSNEYDEITFSTNYEGGRRNEMYFKFLYTGISRARNRVNLVRWKPVSPFEKTEFGFLDQPTKNSSRKLTILVSTMDAVTSDIRSLVERSLADGMTITTAKSVRYQEIYEIAQGDKSFKMIFDYDSNGKVRSPRYAKGDKGLFNAFREGVSGSPLSSGAAEKGQMTWLYDIVSMDILKDCEVSVESSSNYRDILAIKKNASTVNVCVDYKKDNSVSRFRAQSGDKGLFSCIVQAICSYYAIPYPETALWRE
ncbi:MULTISPECIES: ATP-binding domain-containing protein [unclassified Adlercreutzia]|uniref:ATP-binding domain-containing protein n=1 Tax=unclassified Adlercreutzia TaxID=2636013 RepID=UPI0013EC04BD|nr:MULTISPECIES: ATP-binding domain-containing protein [unclassified Adlercreutzia]